jgi:transposase
MADGGDGFDGCVEVVQRTRGYRRWPDEVKGPEVQQLAA